MPSKFNVVRLSSQCNQSYFGFRWYLALKSGLKTRNSLKNVEDFGFALLHAVTAVELLRSGAAKPQPFSIQFISLSLCIAELGCRTRPNDHLRKTRKFRQTPDNTYYRTLADEQEASSAISAESASISARNASYSAVFRVRKFRVITAFSDRPCRVRT